MATTKEEDEFKKKFLNGEHIDDGLELTEEIIGKLGVGRTSKKNAFENLVRNRKETWRNLLDLKSEEKAIDAAGGDEDSGTAIWNAVQDYKKRAALRVEARGMSVRMFPSNRPLMNTSFEADGSPPISLVEAMRETLKNVRFPTLVSEYEFPDLVLPPGNKYADSARQAQVKNFWLSSEPAPDFLVTRLHETLVSLEQFSWNAGKRRLSRSGVPPGPAELKFSGAAPSMSCLVAASGTGKTRYLFEKCYREFGLYITAAVDIGQHGSNDLSAFLSGIFPHPGMDVEAMRTRLIDRMRRILLARVVLLRTLIDRYGSEAFLPRHWLALQLFPAKLTGVDVFKQVVHNTQNIKYADELTAAWSQTPLCFVALDEAQRADSLLPGTFPSATNSQIKRSALSPLIQPFSDIHTNVILSGTGLGIQFAYETASSGTISKESGSVLLFGLTTWFDANEVAKAVRERGVSDAPDRDMLELFAGRPRFSMRLARAILLGTNPSIVADSLVGNIRRDSFPKLKSMSLTATKTVYTEVRFAAQQWSLRGEPSIIQYGELALEAGIGAIQGQGGSTTTNFVIKEPLVIRAFEDLAEPDFEGISNEKDATIGLMLEDYVALNAQEILNSLRAEKLPASEIFADFVGPWKIAKVGVSQRRGVSPKDGNEPAAIAEILENAGEVGTSMVFPGTKMGADVIVAAKRERDNRKLLVFKQIKASLKASGPSAMRSLTLPYHEKRGKSAKGGKKKRILKKKQKDVEQVPADLTPAFEALKTQICDPATSVVFLVFKFPGNVKSRKPTIYNFHGKTVLQIYIDGKNGEELLPNMHRGLEILRDVKRRRPTLFEGGQ